MKTLSSSKDKCPECSHVWATHIHIWHDVGKTGAITGCNEIKIYRGTYVDGKWHPGAFCNCQNVPPEGVELISDVEWED